MTADAGCGARPWRIVSPRPVCVRVCLRAVPVLCSPGPIEGVYKARIKCCKNKKTMSPNRSPEAVAKRMIREQRQLSNEHKGGMRKKKGGDAGGTGKQTGGHAGGIGEQTDAHVETPRGKPDVKGGMRKKKGGHAGGIRKKKGGHAETRSSEPPFVVPRLAGPLPLFEDTVPARDSVLATEVRAVVPATHALLAAARVSCISVECVAASCAISDAEEMQLAAAHWHLYF